MDLFTRADLRELLAEHERPCVSLFMPAHRVRAEEDPIRFRKLLAGAEDRLVAYGLRAPDARELLAPLHSLVEDPSFWDNQSDGLAVFLARDLLRVYRLPWAFAEEVEVGGLFRVAPLLPLLQADGRFYVLAVSQNSVRLLQGTRFTVSPVDLSRFSFSLIGPKGVPPNLAEALLTHDRDEPLTYHTRPTPGGGWGAIFEGHGVGIDDKKDDILRYFRLIDRGLHAVLREEKAPLVVAAVDYLLPIYRQANTYPHLLEKGVEGNPDRLSEKELHDRAWAIVGPQFQENLRRALARYHQAVTAGKATADVIAIVPAAYRGEVETLFVALGKELWGILDPGRNEVTLHDPPLPGDEDLSNLAAVHTLRHGNTVYALRSEEMPTRSPLAAIYHLPLPKHGKSP
ncbi:MAG TPA: hypothetical protein VIL46_15770 [Gemmataceae bacterium]